MEHFDLKMHGTPIFMILVSLLGYIGYVYINAREEKAIVNSLINCLKTGRIEIVAQAFGFREYIIKKNNFIVRFEEYKDNDYSYMKVFHGYDLVYEKNSRDFILGPYEQLSKAVETQLNQTA